MQSEADLTLTDSRCNSRAPCLTLIELKVRDRSKNEFQPAPRGRTPFTAAAFAHRHSGPPTGPAFIPTHHVELSSHEIRGLGAGAMVFTCESKESRRNTTHLERRVVLLALRDRRSSIELAGQGRNLLQG
jgi:hypothetical protein